MDIYFRSKDIADSRKRKGKYAPIIKQLNRRLEQLNSVDNLVQLEKDFPHLRCHEHIGTDTFTVDVSGNKRLRFRSKEEPFRKPDGGIDKSKITSIVIIDIIDPH